MYLYNNEKKHVMIKKISYLGPDELLVYLKG